MIRLFILSVSVALLVAHCSPAKAAEVVTSDHLEDSRIFNIRPLLLNAPKTQKNVKFSSEPAEQQAKRSLSNAELLQFLGLQPMQISSGQQKKRTAEQSRHHGHPDDSHMYIIKLPPHHAYYGSSKGQSESPNSLGETQGRKINVNFQSNGKLGSIYHWNLPVLKQMLQRSHHKGAHSSFYRHAPEEEDEQQLLDIKDIPTWSDPWKGEGDHQQQQQQGKKEVGKVPSYYYAPTQKKGKKTQKYFPGNGKPKSFYVMKGKGPSVRYQKLIH